MKYPYSTNNQDLDEQCIQLARDYYQLKWKYPENYFCDNDDIRKIGIARKINYGQSRWCYLVASCEKATHYTVHASDLGLSDSHQNWQGFFDPKIIADWKEKINSIFPANISKLEVGQKHGKKRLHCHVIAEAGANIKLGKRSVRAIYNLIGLASYLSKPRLPWDEVVAGYYLLIKKERQDEGFKGVPTTSWSHNVKRKKIDPQETSLLFTPANSSEHLQNESNPKTNESSVLTCPTTVNRAYTSVFVTEYPSILSLESMNYSQIQSMEESYENYVLLPIFKVELETNSLNFP